MVSTVGITLWIKKYCNKSVTIFCDNMSVVHMVNKTSSKCKNCMVLIRIIVLTTLKHNVKLTLKHVPGERNNFADMLSRLRYAQFRKESKKQNIKFTKQPEEIPRCLLPMNSIWISNSL